MKQKLTTIASFITTVSFLGANGQIQKEKPIFHYSVMDAMRNGVYIGELSIKSLADKGSFGLGTYNHLDGEMIVLDGIFYRIASDGRVTKAESEREVPFVSCCFF